MYDFAKGRYAVGVTLHGRGYGWSAADRVKAAYEAVTGKSGDDRFEKGTVGYEQFAYRTKRSKDERVTTVTALTGLREVAA